MNINYNRIYIILLANLSKNGLGKRAFINLKSIKEEKWI